MRGRTLTIALILMLTIALIAWALVAYIETGAIGDSDFRPPVPVAPLPTSQPPATPGAGEFLPCNRRPARPRGVDRLRIRRRRRQPALGFRWYSLLHRCGWGAGRAELRGGGVFGVRHPARGYIRRPRWLSLCVRLTAPSSITSMPTSGRAGSMFIKSGRSTPRACRAGATQPAGRPPPGVRYICCLPLRRRARRRWTPRRGGWLMISPALPRLRGSARYPPARRGIYSAGGMRNPPTGATPSGT